MTRLPPAAPLVQALLSLLGREALCRGSAEGVRVEALPSSRRVLRFTFPQDHYAVVGKFFAAYPPQSASDLSLAREYDHYRQLADLGLTHDRGLVPRLLGRRPGLSVGLLLEAVPGPDLDQLLRAAAVQGEGAPLHRGLEKLARLLAFFHSRPVPLSPVSPGPALAYMDKVTAQLQGAGLLFQEDAWALKQECAAWEDRFRDFFDTQVLIHGDATPTNFLFPDGRAVALDLERLRVGDRLWDLSWVAGEVKHAWAWRTGNLDGAEGAIGPFFQAYLAAATPDPSLGRRVYGLNPFYMALAELRIARNHYLTWEYRRELVAEARRCLTGGRRL
jgi:aminoglycoside phosphotransferase